METGLPGDSGLSVVRHAVQEAFALDPATVQTRHPHTAVKTV